MEKKNSYLSSVIQNSDPFKYYLSSILFLAFSILLILSALLTAPNLSILLSVRPPRNFPLMILVQQSLSSSMLNNLLHLPLMLILEKEMATHSSNLAWRIP